MSGSLGEFVESTRCGYCNEKGSCRIDPRTLTCGHSFCLPCLTADVSRTGVVTCPICRETFEMSASLTELPETVTIERSLISEGVATSDLCSSCVGFSANELNKAVSYCYQCDKKYCEQHMQLHSQLMFDHVTRTLDDPADVPSTTMLCRDHKKYLLVVGCSLCNRLYCNMCLLTTPHYCFRATGANNRHRYEVIERLISQTKEKLQADVAKVKDKHSQLQKTVEESSQVLELLESHKEKRLVEARDAEQKQVNEIKERYKLVRQQIVDNNEELKFKLGAFVTSIQEEQEMLCQGESELLSHLSADDDFTLLAGSESLAQKADELTSGVCQQLENFSVVTLALNGNHDEIDVNITNSTVNELAANLSLSALKIKPSEISSTALSLLSALPPPIPAFLNLIRSLHLYKSGTKEPPQEKFCVSNGIFSLSNKWLYRYLAPLESPGKIGAHPDEGTSIQAYRGKLYTRQMKGAELLNVYQLYDTGLGFQVQPKEHSHVFHWEKPLIESFALVGDFAVFCRDSVTPGLLVFNINTKDSPRKVVMQSAPYCQQPIYMCAGPLGHVIILGTEWIEMNDRTEILRLVNIEDGNTVWKTLWNGSRVLQRNPNPITYHNGYIYGFLIKTGLVVVIDGITGSTLKTITIPTVTEDAHIHGIQLCVYNDQELIMPLHHSTRLPPSRGGPVKTENNFVLTHWKIGFEDRRF